MNSWKPKSPASLSSQRNLKTVLNPKAGVRFQGAGDSVKEIFCTVDSVSMVMEMIKTPIKAYITIG